MASEQAQGFLDQATQSIQGGMFNQALDLVDQAIAIEPDLAEAHLLRAIALAQVNQPDAATESFERAISLQPNNSKAHFNLAVHQSRLGNKQQALDHARAALDIDPSHAGARELLNQLERELGIGPANGAGDQPPIQEGPANPYAQGANYYRTGYAPETGGHTLTFVENMGKTWTTIAWVLIGLGAVIMIYSWINSIGQFQEMFSNPEALRRQNQNPWAQFTGGNLVLSLISLTNSLCLLLWMIFDIIDRRSNWLWLVGHVVCCCCGFMPLIPAIYLLAGRKTAA